MKKKLSLLMVALVAVAAFAGLRRAGGDKVMYSWPAGTEQANKVTLAEGVTVEINGNTEKKVSGGKVVTVNETQYTTMKVSNGAQNTLTLPKKAVAVTFYSYVNKTTADASDKDSYWKEVNGVEYTAETSGGAMTKFTDTEDALTNPDVRHFEFETPTDVITFNNAGYQLCYIVEVEYAAEEPQPEPVTTDTWTVAGSIEALFGTVWDPANAANDMTLADDVYTWSKSGVTLTAGDVEFKVVKNHAWGEEYPSENYKLAIAEDGEYDVTITFNAETKDVNATATKKGDVTIPDAEITKVVFLGGFNSWNQSDEMTKGEGNVWTKEVDATNITDDIEFKLLVNGNNWIGNGSTMVIDAPEGWVDGQTEGNWNYILKNSTTGYMTYTVTATWEANSNEANGWTLKIEGKDARVAPVTNTYTAKFENNGNWAEVYAYAWTTVGEGEQEVTTKFLGDWPGTKIEASDEGYVVTIEAAEAPAFIIFNNGGNLQTEDLAFEDGKTYTYTAPVEPVQGIIPDGTYYVMNANSGTLLNAAGALDAMGAPIEIVFNAENGTYNTKGAGNFDAFAVTIAEAYEGMSGYYTIKSDYGYLVANADGATINPQGEDPTADGAVWIFLQQAYWEDIVNSTYFVAGDNALTGEAGWERVESNQMKYNEATGLFEKTFKKVSINAESEPEFKVVKKDMAGNETWYPGENWKITTSYVGGEGVYDITITFDPSDFKEIGVIAKQRIVFPEDAIVFDFEAAADAGENPANKNGSAANGQAFYGWENPEKTDSKRQDYKGYEWAEGSVLPEVCQVWRRSDRINGNVKDGGLYCPNNREMAVDGLAAGDKVIIVYDASNATDQSVIWAIGDGSGDETLSGPRATATINGVEAVTGETTIASGAEILVNSVTPADKGTGYIVFQVKKNMVIQQIAIIKAPAPAVDVYTLVGSFAEWNSEEGKAGEDIAIAGLFDSIWDAENAENPNTMVLDEQTGNYTLSFTDIELPAAGNINYKVVKNHSWAENWGTNDGGNCYYWIDESGKYSITFTFNPNATGTDWFVSCDATRTGEATGINAVKAETLKNAEIFNLAGQRVLNAQKGLYIVNGKKVVLK